MLEFLAYNTNSRLIAGIPLYPAGDHTFENLVEDSWQKSTLTPLTLSGSYSILPRLTLDDFTRDEETSWTA